ncbi:MAG: arsenate reductase family protein [Clostridiales bacterium]|jgi:arsenate reductase|nr:arsenate reductase family protein [Clostridiales bacterium]HOA34040.1 arsenate reductase family protein [Clostridiales bacterium]HOJ35573.1 arsenate reductase family protein [Clostridiales bacterium]HOL79446.1 arsenate reductase family protein [Clostridiales bacterium]HPP68096.1 arsenate reductase family protein [Clostridiales bacterium]
MKAIFICHPRCTTCKKAEKFLESKGADFIKRDITKDNPTKEELIAWQKVSGLDIRKLFNTSGNLYREMGLKDKLDGMSFDEKIELLSTDGLLVKRPILLLGEKVLVGFNEKVWSEALNDGTSL